MTYTTQELINILDQELRANWKGKRVLLSSQERFNNPVIAKAINMEKVGKVFAYQDFRHQIHQYQHQHQVSGVVWRVVQFRDQSLSLPEIHPQLTAIASDKAILIQAKPLVLSFWWEITQSMKYWLASDRQHTITSESIYELIQQAEWAEIDAARTEIYLGLCWGNPLEYQYKWAFPLSGCYRLIASDNQPSSIKF